MLFRSHYDAHHYKKPYVIDGKKYDYIHKPIVEHHTYTKYHDPKLSPKCYGDRCDRKPCKECGDDWAQPGCWHCKNHEGNYGEAAKTTKYAPEKTGEYENAKTYTHKGVTVIVPKQTKAPETPKVEKPKEQPKKVVVVVEEEKKKEKEKDICHKVVKGHGENKYEETVCDKIKYQKESPKKEHKHQDICRKIVSGHGKYRKEEIVCERIEPQKEQPKVHYEPQKEDVCDKVKGCPAPAPAPVPQPQYPKKEEDICDKIKGCPAPTPAPQPQYPEVKPVPAPAPAPQQPKVEPIPVPAPQPQYPKKEEEDICDKIKGCPAPAPTPAPEPQPPKVEPKPAPPPMPKPEEIKPVPVPAPAPPQPPVPVQPEQVRPQGEGSGEAPRVPLTVSKSGASFNTVSIAGTLVVGIVGMMLL